VIQSLTDQVYETIKKEIIACVFYPGQQIAQPQLAERYNVGITPIREALQRLAKEKLVQSIPRFGYIVTPITLADVAEIFELRLILEAASARLAAERSSKEQLEKLADLANYTYVYKDHNSYTEFLMHNSEFHLTVAAASGNRRLVESLSQFLDGLMRVFHLGLDIRDSAEEMRNEHKVLVEALFSRDSDRAERVVCEQVESSQKRVFEALMPILGGNALKPLGQSIRIGNFRSQSVREGKH
jgi:DNA-binding GntR family transcriptional regulator